MKMIYAVRRYVSTSCRWGKLTTELSICLAGDGFKITFVNTKHNQERVRNASIGLKWSFHFVMHGLESEDSSDSGKRSETFLLGLMPGKQEEFIERINASDSDKISCVLVNQSIGWALGPPEKKGIKRAPFCSVASAVLVQKLSIPKLIH